MESIGVEQDIGENSAENKPKSTRAESRAFFDTWGMSSLVLINAHNPGKSIYPGLRDYTFEFTIDPVSSFNNVSQVVFEITDEEINHTWQRSRGHTRAFDQIDSTRTISTSITSSYYTYSPTLGFLDFNVSFGWTNTNTSSNHLIKISIIDSNSNVSKTSVWMTYTVIRAVKLNGVLKVVDEQLNELSEQDWVKSGESIAWSGLDIRYDSTNNFKLPIEHGIISIYNDLGESWVTPEELRPDMKITTTAKPKTDFSDKYIINVTGNAQKFLTSTMEFIIRIDGVGATFYNATPASGSWNKDTQLECSIIVADNTTSGVDIDSVEFQISTDNGLIWLDWQKPKTRWINEPNNLECYKIINFIEGELNLIKWRARDLVGFQTTSNIINIKIDKKPITFKNPIPKAGQFHYSSTIDCSIEINDQTSGINISTVQYSFLIDGESSWSDWTNANIDTIINKNNVKAEQTINFKYGENNFIKWRAKDIAGNGHFESPEYQILVTHKTPKIHYYTPANNSLINTTQPTFIWNNSYVVLQTQTFVFEYWSALEPNNIINITVTEATFTPPQPLKFGTTYFWRVIPNAGDEPGSSESGIWNFTIDSIGNIYPDFAFDIIITPDENFKLYPDDRVEFEFILYNNGNRDDIFQINFVTEPLWDDNIEFNNNVSVPLNGSLSEKVVITTPKSGWEFQNYVLKMKITSLGALEFNETLTKTMTLNIKIVKEPEDKGLPLWFIATLIIVIILLLVWGVIFYNMRKRARYKKFAPPDQIKGKGKDQKKDKDEIEIVYTPEHKKAIDLASKKDLKFKPKN
jgi:hypothetical protein